MEGEELAVSDKFHTGPVPQANNDAQVIAMWLHGRPHTTQRAYAYDVQGLLDAVNQPLKQITLGQLQEYFSNLDGLAPASKARAINTVKSLFSFTQKIGYIQFNPAAAVKGPKIKSALAERILTEAQVH